LCLEKKRRISQKPKKQILKDIDKKLENLTANENEDETDEEKSSHELEENATDEEKVEEVEDVEEVFISFLFLSLSDDSLLRDSIYVLITFLVYFPPHVVEERSDMI